MNPKFSSFLFTELILKLSDKDKHDEIMQELIDRLLFCKFDLNTILAFIELEKIILKNSNINCNVNLYDKYWWLNTDNELSNKKILEKEPSEYFMFLNKEYYEKNIVPKNLMPVSNLISLMDEATYIDIYLKNKINENIRRELNLFKSVSNFNNYQLVSKEIFFRFMSSFEIGNSSSKFPDNMEDSVTMFYENEKNILFLCKWIFKKNLQHEKKNLWKSYSNEYFISKRGGNNGY